ncbi:cytochrome c oxidase subunit II [Parvibaculum sp.]|jgi:cytochrome c oxidase subunit 2|uniref:cytochrome c oxidase subunit II n=1 Tax=Parvibaculum sp. TaxID=2024848 RepID=UPI000C3F4C8B|nr:cytochrome c oxidase subunit II [Parvibaculum sp.]HAC57355.1 cytochrome c oxidase subunit II [Rhodobiaceae bacterium]MAU62034.1 cytochrome c oxidase subunit II [Parvibaculum sp.]MBO6666926.1 cytochrome c oxidase subunit II [Parvibaculum sp.]MBO6691869.1 cytochrome c oxidase subunit II [Parvibaculum sp.]MBO6713547.1 cytochrome c oxidase subunit II [Parvibaculum sp.]|tara:strand:- start:1709 stop:2548 length:840 start_codon:yes stop_codon:yes gene_type:complete
MRFSNFFGLFATALAMGLLGGGFVTAAHATPVDGGLGLQEAVTPVMHDVIAFHSMLLWIISAIVLFVLLLLIVVMVRFNSRANPTPSKTTHNTLLEVAWTVLPVMILVAIAIPSFRLLYKQVVIPEAELTVKAVGYQWYWGYEYPDNGDISLISNMVEDADLEPGQPRLLAADEAMVVPVDTTVRVIVTSADVIHAFAVPQFGVKIDAVPGRLNETWFRAEKTGMYYGQCSELCGTRHAFMPINVKVVSKEEFQAWAEQQQADAGSDGKVKLAQAADAR